LLDGRKQYVGAERFEQVMAVSRIQANMLQRIPGHLDNRCTGPFSENGDLGATTIWKNAVDERHIDVRRSQNRMRFFHGSYRAYPILRLQRCLESIQNQWFVLNNQDVDTIGHLTPVSNPGL
jgi:hypothetical protein